MTWKTLILMLALMGSMIWFSTTMPTEATHITKAQATPESQKCIQCHSAMHLNLVAAWERGRHAEHNVGCYECHKAKPGEKDAIDDHYGYTISAIVSPKDCGGCHAEQAASFLKSHHSKAGRILASSDNFWGEIVEGHAAAINGCQACHGTKIEIDPKTKQPTPETYPNSGIGRMNPDGTEGNCTACHQRHDFRMDAVRKAETCGRCHLGPDHPQIEIWHSSKHGQAYEESNKHIDMNKEQLVLGKDTLGAPTCATCHLGATDSGLKQTHDPEERMSWKNGGIVSKRTKDWKKKRAAMQTTCRNCHSPMWIKNFYVQYDKCIALYNQKFAIPAKEIILQLKAEGLIDANPVNEEVERHFWHLWHHEGRRARMGASMMGADYVQWEGFYLVALNFYFDFLPAAEKLKPGITEKVMNKPEHHWLRDKISTPEELKAAIKKSSEFWETTLPEGYLEIHNKE